MAINQARVSVAATATIVSNATNSGRSGLSVAIQNPSDSVTVYLGTSSVTTIAYGHALLPLSTFTIDLAQGEILYGIVASSTQTVNVLTQGN